MTVSFETYNKAGKYQTLSLVLFVAAALLTTVSIVAGTHILAAVNGAIMIANLAIYQTTSRIMDNARKDHL